MARSINFCKQAFRSSNLFGNNLNGRNLYFKISARYLRGSRFYKGLLAEEEKFQHVLKTVEQNSKQSSSEASSDTQHIFEEKSSIQEENDSLRKEQHNKITLENQFERLEEKIVPLGKLLYPLQLQKKYKKSYLVLRELGVQLRRLKVPITLGPNALPCPLELTVPSPLLVEYRNKDEFSIGCGADGNSKTVGFFLGSPTVNPEAVCVSPDALDIIKKSHKDFIKDFQDYIRLSPLPASLSYDDGGYWQSVTVRSNSKGDLMGVIALHPQNMTDEEVYVEKKKLKHYFTFVAGNKYNLKSLFLQTCPHLHCTEDQDPYDLLLGEPYIVEELNELKFQISPESFFLVNTKAAERMYNSLLKLLRVKPSTTIIDICCGTGPVSLLLSPFVKRCIGIDACNQAVNDARQNAITNRRQNVEFIQCQPDHILRHILNDGYHDDLVAVINASKVPLGKSLIKALRECRHLKKVIYISRSPTASLDNFVLLCKPSGPHQYLGKAFLPILATPFDLYPQTEHYGLVTMFQRLQF